jgi:ATP/maltotriose-dependent transcriptional regulator MalT
MMGRADTARSRMQKEFDNAAELDSPFLLAFAQFVAAMLKIQLREPAAAESLANDSIASSVQHGFPYIGVFSRMTLGRARASLGHSAEEVSLIRKGIAELPETDRNGMLFLSWLAEAESLDGATGDALATIQQALEANPMERPFLGDALRIRGELRTKVGQTAGAEVDFRDALSCAHKIATTAFELRAATGLARMLKARGDISERATS